jgi:glycosyltransferase 2 family protein
MRCSERGRAQSCAECNLSRDESCVDWLRKHRWKVAISLVVTLAFVWLLRKGALPFLPEPNAFARVQWWTFGAYLALWSLMHFLRAWRWRFLLDPIYRVPMRKLILASFIGFAAIVVLPVRAGEFVRPALVREKGKLSGWSATGTVAAERIIDGLLLSLLLWVGIVCSERLDPLPETIGSLGISPQVVPNATYIALAVFVTAFAVMALFWVARRWARETLRAVIGVFSESLASWVAERIERVTDGLKFLPHAGNTLPFIAWTAVYWLLNAAATWVLAYGCGLPALSFAQACVLTGFLALGIMVPNAPGFFGQFQFSMYAALSLFVPEQQLLAEGSVLVFLLYVGQTAIILLSALYAVVALQTPLRSALDAEDQALEGSWEPEP